MDSQAELGPSALITPLHHPHQCRGSCSNFRFEHSVSQSPAVNQEGRVWPWEGKLGSFLFVSSEEAVGVLGGLPVSQPSSICPCSSQISDVKGWPAGCWHLKNVYMWDPQTIISFPHEAHFSSQPVALVLTFFLPVDLADRGISAGKCTPPPSLES